MPTYLEPTQEAGRAFVMRQIEGSVVMLNDCSKAVTNFGSSQLKALAGKHSSEIAKILGPGHKDVVAIPEDIVFLDY